MPRAAATAIPDRVKRELKVKDLSGGLDHRRTPTLVPAHRSRVCRNWTLDEPGALKVYPGWEAFTTTSLGAGRGQGGKRVYLGNTTPFTLYGWGGNVYRPTDAGVMGAAVLTGLHATNQFDFPHGAEMVAVLDGVNLPKWSEDGTAWFAMGIAAPLAAAVAAPLAGGTLTLADVHEMSYSYQNDALGHEGNESPTVELTPAGANRSIRYTIPASSDPQVDTINVYIRDVTAGEEVRRFAGSVANPGVGTATFDLTSITWTDGDEAPQDHDLPLAFEFAVSWKNRWWAVIGRNLYFSQIFEPQSWPALFFIEIPFELGDDISAIIPQGDTLVVFGEASKPYLIIGQTSLDFEVRPAFGAQSGAFGFRSVAAIENGILHAVDEGVYLFDGAADRLLTDDISGPDIGWQHMVKRVAATDLDKTHVVYDAARKFVHVLVDQLYPFGTAGEWVLDLHRTRLSGEPAWTSTDRTLGGYIIWNGHEPIAGDRGRLFSWSDTIGRLYEECIGTTADGGDMVADYTGPTFATGGVMSRFPQMYGEYRPASGSFSVEVLVDGQSGGIEMIDIEQGISFYGIAEYGVDDYGGAERQAFPLMLPLEAEGLTIYLRARYLGQEQFAFYTYEFIQAPELIPRGIRT